jgi:hypothetical protein
MFDSLMNLAQAGSIGKQARNSGAGAVCNAVCNHLSQAPALKTRSYQHGSVKPVSKLNLNFAESVR